MTTTNASRLFCAILACAAFTLPAAARAETKGAGSSLARGLVELWSKKANGEPISYTANGSSAGVKALVDNTVDFAITDKPLGRIELERLGLKQLPLAATAVAIVANIPGLDTNKPIKLSGTILADIYLGVIDNWSNTAIASMNPDLKLPNLSIVPMWRADGSGTSYAFTTYLARGNQTWRRQYGATQSVNLKIGVSHTGGAALLAAVKAKSGAIGYDAIGQIAKTGLAPATLENAMNRYVTANASSITDRKSVV